MLETRKYGHSKEIEEKYDKLMLQYSTKNFKSNQFRDGQHIIAINGTSDMFAPETTEEIRAKLKEDLRYAVAIAKDIPNLSVILNGDMIYDYNKGYIVKKDYCAEVMADIRELCDILEPIKDKVIAINNGKMEAGIMTVEKDKATGRYSKGKEELKELANYATQVLQLDESLAYAPYNREEMRTKKLAIQTNEVNEENQKVLNKAYEDFMKKFKKDENAISELDDEMFSLGKKLDEKKIKEALVKKLRKEHQILDISSEEDRKIINERYPLEYIDLRIPNENLIGNIFCKMLNIQSKKTKVNHVLNAPIVTKINTATGNTKVVYNYYTPSLPKFMKELPAKLNTINEPPDVVVVNSYANKSNGDLQEFTTQLRVSYVNKNGVKKVKDVLILDSGSFAYSRLLTTGRVPTNLVYKVVDIDPIFNTLVPKNSVNYMSPKVKRTVMEKYNYESIHNKFNPLNKMISDTIDESYEKTLKKYYYGYNLKKSKEFVTKKRATLNQSMSDSNQEEKTFDKSEE